MRWTASGIQRAVRTGCLAVLLAFASSVAPAAEPYGLPVCQAIANDLTADAVVREEQLEHCDAVEEALIEFVNHAPQLGISDREAYLFAMLYIAPAHWQILAEIDFAASCGNGTCDAGETPGICPQDCSGGSSSGAAGSSSGGSGVPGGSQ